MDDLDSDLIAALRRNARASISELAATLGVTRTTLRARIARLEKSGEITGYTVQTRADADHMPVRGLMMLAIEGRGTDKVVHRLQGLPEVEEIHSTNGRWDLIVTLGTETLEAFDRVLSAIRRFENVAQSETSLLLTSLPRGPRR